MGNVAGTCALPRPAHRPWGGDAVRHHLSGLAGAAPAHGPHASLHISCQGQLLSVPPVYSTCLSVLWVYMLSATLCFVGQHAVSQDAMETCWQLQCKPVESARAQLICTCVFHSVLTLHVSLSKCCRGISLEAVLAMSYQPFSKLPDVTCGQNPSSVCRLAAVCSRKLSISQWCLGEPC